MMLMLIVMMLKHCLRFNTGEARVVGHDVSCIMIPLYDADADCDDVETLSQV